MRRILLYLTGFILLFTLHGQNKEVDDIISLTNSGITNTIIKSYIDGYTNRFTLTSTNIVSMKKSGVTDDVILHLLEKRNSLDVIPIKVEEVVIEPRIMDEMESRDFFYRFYLLPRAIGVSKEMEKRKK